MDPTKKQIRSAKPSSLEQDIIGRADYLRQQGKPLHLILQVDEEIFNGGKKPELEPQLLMYGSILDNHDFSHIISLNVGDVASIRRIVRDYESGRLKGIVGMELSPMDAVLCGYRAV